MLSCDRSPENSSCLEMRAQPEMIWANCPSENNWQQLLISDGPTGFIEVRNPPSCVMNNSQPSTDDMPFQIPTIRPPSANSSESLSPQISRLPEPARCRSRSPAQNRTSFLSQRTPPSTLKIDRTPVRAMMSPEFTRASPKPSVVNSVTLESIVRQLSKAESVSSSVVRRIENLKKKSTAVIDVL